MKRIGLPVRAEVLPALYGRAPTPVQKVARGHARLSFDQRNTRPSRFPVEQALAGVPEPSRVGRYLDIEV